MERRQFAVIGLGRFGSSLARELVRLDYEVLGIDKCEAIINDMKEELTHAVVADATDEDALRALGVRNFDCAVVAIGDDIQASVMAAILLKDLGVRQVIAKAITELHGKVLERIGVDRVVFPERDMGVRVAHQLASPNLLDYIGLSREYTIAELAVPRRLAGRTIRELDLRRRFGCSVVAINKRGGVVITPSPDDVIEEKDVMVVIGKNEQVEAFEHEVCR
ncbi:MAG: potassium uptake system protein [Candidatus Reconcilbacillus cellulovorans]|uniref:Potassium uptake system protein n=1 Tax=Candidatus Reconcilbacillus cellulovorans TaxID=1906605 RepID=A0A2A6DYV4_9BACL|nr:MAG: potassium uptake system protein [Candidatus Reconcilbacillus cellulovorans]